MDIPSSYYFKYLLHFFININLNEIPLLNKNEINVHIYDNIEATKKKSNIKHYLCIPFTQNSSKGHSVVPEGRSVVA